MGDTKGTKVFTTVREFEIDDNYEDFQERFRQARARGEGVIDAQLQEAPIMFNIDTVAAFIPIIDLGF